MHDSSDMRRETHDSDQILANVGHVRVESSDETSVVREDVLTISTDGTENLSSNIESAQRRGI